jgi:UDP-N-acetylmuramoyl-tripeptide--D-alanyl-D-alanine ligase
MQHIPPRTQKIIEEVSEDTPGYTIHSSTACKPNTIVITAVDKSHFEAFGSQDAIVEEICSVTKAMDKNGTVIINKDDFENLSQFLNIDKIITVSITDTNADIYAQNIQVVNAGLEFDIIDGTTKYSKVKLYNIYAVHNVLIALFAYAAGKSEGVTPQNIIKGIQNFKTLGIRQNIFRTSDNVLVYADCYNAVAKSIESAIKSAEIIPLNEKASGKNRRIAVLGDVEEAGELSQQTHEDIINIVNNSLFDHLIIT